MFLPKKDLLKAQEIRILMRGIRRLGHAEEGIAYVNRRNSLILSPCRKIPVFFTITVIGPPVPLKDCDTLVRNFE